MRHFVLAVLAAISIAACACDHDHGADAEPACRSPAPLVTAKDGRVADEYIVEVRDEAEIDALVARHYIEVRTRLPIIRGFSATMRPATVAALRCEPAVTRITEDRQSKALTDTL